MMINSKSEYRNPKQISNPNDPNPKQLLGLCRGCRRRGGKGLRTELCLFSAVFCLAAFVTGCSGPDKGLPLFDEVNRLKDEKAQLEKRIEQTEAEKEQLEKQNKVLSGLPAEVKGEKLYRLEAVRIGRLTNLYDKNDDGKKEKLIVYIQPIDQDGDIIKAAGSVEVKLWNLNNEDGKAELGEWKVGPDELKKLWFAAMMAVNYRLAFDVGDKVKDYTEPLTVRVAFTDYLTGKVFKEQREIKPLEVGQAIPGGK